MTDTESKPLLLLKDGGIVKFEDSHFQSGDGGCDTCGWGSESCDTNLTITYVYNGADKKHVERIEGVNGSYALSYVMHNLSALPDTPLSEFLAGLRNFCESKR